MEAAPGTPEPHPPHVRRHRFRPRHLPARPPTLFWRVFTVNATLLVAAVVILALSPATVSFPVEPRQALVLAIGLVVLLAANAVLLRVSLKPLQALAQLMRRIDLLTPGERLAADGARELRVVTAGFNEMLDRLELERRSNSSRVVFDQEEERRRIASELHDQVGQGLTALLLQLKRLASESPPEVRARLVQAQALTRANLDEVRRIARQLRPTVLDDLGLPYALHALVDVSAGSADIEFVRRIDLRLPRLPPATELAFWRIAQEGVTNVLRHANATKVELELHAIPNGDVRLTITDNGRGMIYAADVEGGGIRGMRERALAVDARLDIRSRPGGGTTVTVIAAP